MFEKILVPLDASQIAEQVIPHVGELANAFGAEVELINVCEPEDTESGKTCRVYLFTVADKLKKLIDNPGSKVEIEVVSGRPDKKILHYAENQHINLIVMTSHGKSGIMPWSLGATVNNVLHKVRIPLIVVRARERLTEADNASLFRKVLIPLDGSKRSEMVLPVISEITKKISSEVILVQVVESGRHVHTVGGINYVLYKDHDLAKIKLRAAEYLNEASAKLIGEKVKVSSEVRKGNNAQEIIKLAAEKGCTLIALSSHGHSGIEAWMVGSVTHKILQASEKSVLFVPALET